jgi:hypothetical protein
MKPVARKSGLVVRDLADEVVVYDTDRHEAHCLNRTAAVVFRHADGKRDISDLAALLSADGAPGAEGFVGMALGQLGEAGLLESAPSSPTVPGLARRDAMRRVGLGAAILLPLVTSVLAPSPAEAAATCVVGDAGCAVGPQPPGTPCTCTVPPCLGTCDGAGNCSLGPC